MLWYSVKIVLTALIVVAISEISKRWVFWGALVASLPLISVLAIAWLYIDTQNLNKTIELSQSIFWIVIPSLIFFISFPFFAKLTSMFWGSLALACLTTASAYWVYLKVLAKLGIEI